MLSSSTWLWWCSSGVSVASSLSSTSVLGSPYFHITIEEDRAPLPWRQNRNINYLSFFWVRGLSSSVLCHWTLKHLCTQFNPVSYYLSLYVITLCCCCCSNCFIPSLWERLYLGLCPSGTHCPCKDNVVGGFSLFSFLEDGMVSLCVFPLPVNLYAIWIKPVNQRILVPPVRESYQKSWMLTVLFHLWDFF